MVRSKRHFIAFYFRIQDQLVENQNKVTFKEKNIIS